jgi:hypothetical protein
LKDEGNTIVRSEKKEVNRKKEIRRKKLKLRGGVVKITRETERRQ